MRLNFRSILYLLTSISFACFSCTNFGNKSKISEFRDINPQKYEGNESLFSESDKQPVTIKVDQFKNSDPFQLPAMEKGVTIEVDQFKDMLLLNLSSFLDTIWHVKLSNKDAATIGIINKIIFHDNCIYILDRYKTKSLKKFSAGGNYLSSIGKYGGGPGEYAEPTDFVVTNDEVIVYDQFNVRLNYYNHQGKFLRSKRLPFLFFQFRLFSPDRYVFFSLDNENNHLESIVNYSVFETDSNFVIRKKGFFREKDKYNSILIDANYIADSNKIYYHPPYNDTVFSIGSDNRITPEYAIDFGNKKLPEYYLLSKNRKAFYKVSEEEDKYAVFSGDVLPLSDYFYFGFTLKRLMYKCIYSKKSGKLITGNGLINDINYIFTFSNILTSINGNTLVGYNQSYDIAENRKKNSREVFVKYIGERYTAITDSIKPDDNPILVFYKLKDF
ncbi:hypothetical protein FACS1894174_00640 [Bacteroidia bacterium]|nr:hypothetical protein FACS1894203_2360 [Bacteroidia bacterium]GHV19876.1 hypothetical protein FACS1894174_00640 [Bacteroidia bacterium]